MRFNAHLFIFPTLFFMAGVLAQQTGEPTSGTPDVTYTVLNYCVDSFVFCSEQDCTGTCEVVNPGDTRAGDLQYPPNDMGFLSTYWYDPGNFNWQFWTCLAEPCTEEVNIAPNTCYNVYDNGVPTDFLGYWYTINGVKQ